MTDSTSIQQKIEDRLNAQLHPNYLLVVDESKQHHGHQNFERNHSTHFFIRVVSDKFVGLSRLERQKLMHALLADFWQEGVHSIHFDLKTEGEDPHF